MCGRYVQTMPADAMRRLFRTAGALPNLAPSRRGARLRRSDDPLAKPDAGAIQLGWPTTAWASRTTP